MAETVPVGVVETPEFLAATRKLMSDDERADVVLWWPHGRIDAETLAGWRRRLMPGGAIWCVTGSDPSKLEMGAGPLLDSAGVAGLAQTGVLFLPTGERAVRLAPATPA